MIVKNEFHLLFVVKKVNVSDPIAIKLIPDMSCHLLNVYTKLLIDISKHVEESPENSDERTDVWKSNNLAEKRSLMN